ncbi:MAG: hypothetical protein EOP47_19490 [Sphingobacteriaceae bacterium]|nr:MAG: hypothetical protein EOP47_19490 [Sphingobacteriaceae bacterium]
MRSNPFTIPYYLIALSTCIGLSANAQKLPNVQATGIYAPANVKVDGKATEWGNQLQAYNKNTSLFYTLANNNDNIYLTIQANDKVALQKAIGGGITFTITSKEKGAKAVSVSTPYLLGSNRSKITQKINIQDTLIEADLPVLNNVISANFKEISIKGIAAIPDSTISIYNEHGIKISGLIDINKAYTCELAIPLKYIKQLTGTAGTFNYNLKLNGIKSEAVVIKDGSNNMSTTAIAGALRQMGGMTVGDGVTVVGTARSVYGASPMELMNPTDFSGTYTLVKK